MYAASRDAIESRNHVTSDMLNLFRVVSYMRYILPMSETWEDRHRIQVPDSETISCCAENPCLQVN